MNQIIQKEKIENLIYEVRGKQVMLDSDLAILYKTPTGNINRAVKRNIKRFPKDFYFQLSYDEYKYLLCQFGIANKKGGRTVLPYVFTEQGVSMLSSVLKTDIAAEVSVNIMRAFVAMRKYISNNLIEQKYINSLVLEDHENIKLLQELFSKLEEKKKVSETYYNGQIYDAYSKIIEIFKTAKKELIIIDRYADITVLDMIKKLEVKVILIAKVNSLLTNQDIERYNSQYSNLRVIYNDDYHDRYFIIDKKEVYHCGASINHAGTRTFSINKWEDRHICNNFIETIKNNL